MWDNVELVATRDRLNVRILKKMKIVVPAIGSRGDVQPYINLCQALTAAKHNVVIATNPTLCDLVLEHGVACVPVGSPIDMGVEGARLLERSFNNIYIGMIRVMQLAMRLVEEAFDDVLGACRSADLVIVSDTGSGMAEADKLGIPWISVTLQPARIPAERQVPLNVFQRILWGLIGRIMVLPINRFRKRVGAPLVSDVASMQSQRMLLLPVNQHVAPPDPNWPDYVHQTNFWFAQPQKDWRPPRDLIEFLHAGETPIAVSLGVMSMHGHKAQVSAKVILEAIKQVGVRAIIQGWNEIYQEEISHTDIYFTGSMPHDWLFDQVQAVIHHGGFGTTAAVLRAGVPGIVIPHVIDQFYWGQRVAQLGTGPKPIRRSKINVANIREALSQAMFNVAIRENARRMGEYIRSDPDGVKTAVSIIESEI